MHKIHCYLHFNRSSWCDLCHFQC